MSTSNGAHAVPVVPPVPEPVALDPALAPGAVPPRLFRRWSMAELLDADRTFRWRVRGLVVDPTYGMVAGEQKTLKTYVATFINVAVAAGVPVFGRFEVDQPAPVVAYVGEGGRVPYTRRLERVAQAMGVDLRHIPLFPSFETAPVLSDDFRWTLARDLAELEPGLVSLDPLYAFHGAGPDARNLHEEAELLTALSGPCVDAGASLVVVNHFNKTGTGRGLDRITMAGAKEWCDSWWLLSHREVPDVPNGRFRLLLEVGSRQWGGSSWDLDLDVGAFDAERGEYDGEIAWDIRRHAEGGGETDDDEARVLAAAAGHPFELTREELAKAAGGQVKRMRQVVDHLERKGVLRTELVVRPRSDGRLRKVWVFGPASEAGRHETEELVA